MCDYFAPVKNPVKILDFESRRHELCDYFSQGKNPDPTFSLCYWNESDAGNYLEYNGYGRYASEPWLASHPLISACHVHGHNANVFRNGLEKTISTERERLFPAFRPFDAVHPNPARPLLKHPSIVYIFSTNMDKHNCNHPSHDHPRHEEGFVLQSTRRHAIDLVMASTGTRPPGMLVNNNKR